MLFFVNMFFYKIEMHKYKSFYKIKVHKCYFTVDLVAQCLYWALPCRMWSTKPASLVQPGTLHVNLI